MRITSERGFFQLSIPDPCHLEKTKDWGYPDEKKHAHYRVYGIDIEKKFKQAFLENSDVIMVKVISEDPLTEL